MAAIVRLTGGADAPMDFRGNAMMGMFGDVGAGGGGGLSMYVPWQEPLQIDYNDGSTIEVPSILPQPGDLPLNPMPVIPFDVIDRRQREITQAQIRDLEERLRRIQGAEQTASVANAKIQNLEIKIAALEAENAELKKEMARRRLRPGDARIVE